MRPLKRIPSLQVLLVVLAGMSLYEWSKQLLLPNVTLWHSHLITIALTTLAATVAAHVVSRRHLLVTQRLGAQIAERQRNEELLRESEARYRSLFEHSMDGVLLTAPDGSILAANRSACRIFGRTEEELCQAGRAGVVDETDPRLAALLEERARTGMCRGELTLRRRDGTTFPGEVSSAVFTDRNGNLRTSMIIHDISERKWAEEAIRNLARFPHENPSPVMRVGPDGTILYANEASAPLLTD